ncbi:MAG: GlsB/YeaQ/YmgE family stress response membrane protein [Lysobacterales bacterium]|nr:MAG: GlsB/YeaQ/YmgE family stress response membrane protein [Xanthomonadales bacterium]
MSIVTWLVAGGLVGWGACAYMGTPTSQAFAFNAVVATVGAAVGLWTLGTTFDIAPGLNVFAVIVGVVCGAVVLLMVHLVRRIVTS